MPWVYLFVIALFFCMLELLNVLFINLYCIFIFMIFIGLPYFALSFCTCPIIYILAKLSCLWFGLSQELCRKGTFDFEQLSLNRRFFLLWYFSAVLSYVATLFYYYCVLQSSEQCVHPKWYVQLIRVPICFLHLQQSNHFKQLFAIFLIYYRVSLANHDI